jgi:signal transduction histidine kinase
MAGLKQFRQRFQFAMALGVTLLALIALAIPLRMESMREVSDAQLERTQRRLREATHRFTDDFDREITRALFYFALEPSADTHQLEQQLSERFELWAEHSPHPKLVASVYLERESNRHQHELLRLDSTTGQFLPLDWPPHFSRLLSELENQQDGRSRRHGQRPSISAFQDEIPALVLPAFCCGTRESSYRRSPAPDADSHVIIELAKSFISGELLPDLAERHLAIHDGPPYQIAVIRPGDPAEVIFQSTEGLSIDDFSTSDAQEQLFDTLHREHLRELWSDVGLSLGTLAPGSGPNRTDRGRGSRSSRSDVPSSVPSQTWQEEGRWQVLVRHPAGSLQIAFDRRRRRNMLLSLGILGLLGTTAVLLVVSTQRAQKFAKQQVEFVSSVSHELRTPLSVIRMAARNLERGTIRDAEGVKRYATLIGNEELRLTEMVERVLAFGQTQSNEKAYSRQTVSLREVIDAALADCRPLIEEREARVEANLSSDELFTSGDPDALRQAVQNLVANAVKHAGLQPHVTIEATATTSTKRSEIAITVKDRGPGIAKKDLAHIFEPFYRGSRAVKDQTRGSGLGLTLVKEIVEAHGGKVTVKSNDRGTAFTLHLPATAPGNTSNESTQD